MSHLLVTQLLEKVFVPHGLTAVGHAAREEAAGLERVGIPGVR